jgi:hypothetical protein
MPGAPQRGAVDLDLTAGHRARDEPVEDLVGEVAQSVAVQLPARGAQPERLGGVEAVDGLQQRVVEARSYERRADRLAAQTLGDDEDGVQDFMARLKVEAPA